MPPRPLPLTILAAASPLLLMLLPGCSASDGGANQPAAAPLVKVEQATDRLFLDVIEAVGTARANEQVTISSPVTERIDRLYFDDGDFVRRDQMIAMLSQEQEQASLAAALATEQQVTAQLARIQTLSDRGFATRTQLDTQVAQLARARAEADDARARIADRTVRAPLSGAVSLRTISAGSIVSVGDPIATVSDISRIKLDFAVPETVLGNLRPGQSIEVSSAAYPGVLFSGSIATIDPLIDPNTRAVAVRAVMPNPGGRLKPGMLLQVRIRSAERRMPSIPELAVIGDGRDRFVYVVDPAGKARRVGVTTGARDGGFIEVAGLPNGARVVTEGAIKIADGVAVQIAGKIADPRPSSQQEGKAG